MTAIERFGRYRVTGTLGAGAMGEVYAAVDDVLGREVAIKVLKPHRNALAARLLDERFRQEARAIASLTHPNVVVVFDIGLDADPPYLVMERVAGPSLKEQLARGPLSESEVRALGIQIARALAAAHERGIVHRDVKPANILVAGEATWKLADFGVAHVPDSSITMTGQFVGSPAYAPPEALLRGQCDREGDVFGLGAVLYHVATGAWPRLEQTSGALLAPLPPIRTIAPALSEELARAIDRAVRTEPAERPSAAALADELASAAASTAPPDRPSASLPGTSSPMSSTAPPAAMSSPATNAPHASTSTSPRDSTSVSGASGAMTPVPIAPLRWKPWAIGGAVFVLFVILIASTRSGSAPASSISPTSSGPMRPPPEEPIQIADPPMPGGKAEKDWRKVVDQIDRGHYREALDKLEGWERKWGATPETEALRAQLASRADRSGQPRGRED